jgi:DNA polymerase-3 subunit alpha
MDSIALTDHGVMYGIPEFYRLASLAGIKPIIGCEIYLAPNSRFDKSSRKEDSPTHLTLLAENNQGYKNLMSLVSLAFLDGFYYRPRLDIELLSKYHQGIICLSGCMTSKVSKLLLTGKRKEAVSFCQQLQSIFGSDNFFLEVQNQGLEGQEQLVKETIEISSEIGAPLVATNDVHYLEQKDYLAHDVLLCIQTGSTLEEKNRLKFQTDQFYLKSAEEMREIFAENLEAISNTGDLAKRCEAEIKFGKVFLPKFTPPGGEKPQEYLQKLCWEGLKEKFQEVTEELKGRLERELSVIEETGFATYFLIVADFVNYARKNGIRVGPGRGSAAGSLVAYCLGITNINPLEHGLLFERFLNPNRVSMPDIDIDFSYERRDEVIEYVTKKYGRDRVAQIITFGTMAARQAIRDTGRVYGQSYGFVDRIAKMVPEGPNVKLENALQVSPELKSEYSSNEISREIISTALKLEGLARHDSVHAAGVVISNSNLTNYAPLQQKPDTEVVTQYSKEIISDIGLLKVDFLGLRTLSIIDEALRIIKMRHGLDLDIDNLSLDDQTTYNLLQQGKTVGVFQLESSGMRSLIKEIKPSRFADLVALLALYRPGPLQGGMTKYFSDYKHGRKKINYLHPKLEPILAETYGVILYQEQVMQIATEIAGFSMSEADELRAAISKKKDKQFKKSKQKFIQGCCSKGVSKEVATKLFDLLEQFSGYGFNKSHAAAYAMISYQTAYLKAHYPVEFMAGLLTNVMGNKDKISRHVNECRQLNIQVLPPDVNESFAGFTVVADDKIRFGLSAVKNVGEAAVRSIVEARNLGGKFKSISDFVARIDSGILNKRALESLIKCGAFDSLNLSRKQLLKVYGKAIEQGAKMRRDLASGQESLFSEQDQAIEIPQSETVEEFSREELAAMEKEILGLYIGDSPLLEVADQLSKEVDFSLGDLADQPDRKEAKVGGMISHISKITTKKGEPMAFATIEDLEGSMEVVIFPSLLEKKREAIKEDKVVIFQGRIDVKEDGTKLIAKDVRLLGEKPVSKKNSKPISKPNQPSRPLLLQIEANKLNGDFVSGLRKKLISHPGRSKVYLKLLEDKKTTTFLFSHDFLVDAEACLTELSDWLGPESVSLG